MNLEARQGSHQGRQKEEEHEEVHALRLFSDWDVCKASLINLYLSASSEYGKSKDVIALIADLN